MSRIKHSDRVGLEPIGLILMYILILHITCKKEVTEGFALLDCFSLKFLELVVTFGSSLFSIVAEQFLASLSSLWDRESHQMCQNQQRIRPQAKCPLIAKFPVEDVFSNKSFPLLWSRD